MTNTYDTAAIPIGSTAVKVLYNNASNLDEAVNGTPPSWADRFGVTRKSWAGIESDFNSFLLASGYEYVGDYVTNSPLTITRPNQIFTHSGEYYRAAPTLTLPYTTVANWSIDAPKFVSIGDAALRSALASTDPNMGVSLVTGSNRVVHTIAQMKALPKTGSVHVLLIASGIGGEFFLDLADIVTPDNGVTVFVAADGGRFKRKYTGAVYLTWAGAVKGDPSPDTAAQAANVAANNAALATIYAFLVAEIAVGRNPPIVVPEGIYCYSVFPNFAIQNTSFTGEGEVRFRYFGTDTAIIYDGTAGSGGGVSGVTFGGFHVDVPPTAKDGVRISWIRRGSNIFGINVHGAGPTYSGFKITSCVVPTFNDLVCSGNEPGGWYLGALPAVGFTLDETTGIVGSQCSWPQFFNLVAEGMAVGVDCINCLGATFFGGTMEGCSAAGLRFQAPAQQCKVFHVDFEANGFADIYFIGTRNEAFGCHALTAFVFDANASNNNVFGGNIRSVTFAAGSVNNFMSGVHLNQFGDGGIGGAGINQNRIADCFNVNAGQWFNGAKIDTSLGGASPLNHTNTTANDEVIVIDGGTISSISYNAGSGILGLGTSQRQLVMHPGDAVTIVHTGSIIHAIRG